MAYSPCTNCRATNQGRLRYIYVTTFNGDERINRRMRLDDGCFMELVEPIIAIAEVQDQRGNWLTKEESI